MCYGFFIQAGVKPSDAPYLRKIGVQMSAVGYGGINYFMELPIEEFVEVANEICKVAKERRNRAKTRR